MAHKILQDANKALYIAKEVEELTVEEAHKLYDHLKNDLALLENYLADKLGQPSGTDTTTGQPAAPADTTQPTEQNQPAPVEQTQDTNPAPADPNAPQNGVQQPVQAYDANGNPVQPAPAIDPNTGLPVNQPQTQTEQPVFQPLQ